MRIETVWAHAFGPFTGERLDLATGMTLVSGANEAGKSTWHAALYAGLCGLRRGAGRAREDQAFSERHRPWDGQTWAAGTLVLLEDGRRLELRHDLDARIGHARDTVLGRDVSAEILFDGAPDGSRWLGLDRRVFLATACVRQTEILDIARNADALQEYLQRAATGSGDGTTAATALEGIKQFRAENVGSDRVNGVGPLRRAERQVEAASQELERARARKVSYDALLEDVQTREHDLTAAEVRLAHFDAAQPEAVASAETTGDAPPPRGNSLFVALGLAVLLLIAGTGLIVIGQPIPGAAGLAAAFGLVWWTRTISNRPPASTSPGQIERRAQLEEVVRNALRAYAEAQGRAAQAAQELPDVAAAEEAVAAARDELARVRDLDRLLGLTAEFLERAQLRIHREIAPILAESVRCHLAPITAGRYVDVAVDPASLVVRVQEAGGQWRRAGLLSHGTAEQIYLLLRVAMAEHLTRTGEVCPLVLDDVTVHCDERRKLAVLGTLYVLSQDRQVVLFSQEGMVRRWAEDAFDPRRDRIVELEGLDSARTVGGAVARRA